jgi:hypothetical protein
VSTQRDSVVVFSNQNSSASTSEYWGTAQWGVVEGTFTPTDGSGATLGNLGAGRYTKIGRMVHWQATIVYPATADGSNAIVAGLPFAVSAGTSFQGRGGAVVSSSDVGSAVGILQGVSTTTSFNFVSPTAGTAIVNSTLSGRTLYVGGHYMI